MELKTTYVKMLGHTSIQSKFQLSGAFELKMLTRKIFEIVVAQLFTERLKQLWDGKFPF